MAGTLFVVATPIGNLEDITARALRVLREVDLIAAEDTRRTAHLLTRFGISTRTTSLHEHNEYDKSAALLARLLAGENIALVSDAGTPAISDPGATFVRQAAEAGIRVEPIPGASALTALLSVSGFSGERFTFLGFPPTRSKDRERWFQELAAATPLAVFYEAPHRIRQTLQQIQDRLGNVILVLGRELSKAHEELVRGPISQVLNELREPRGEYVVAVEIGQTTETGTAEASQGPRLAHEFGELTNSSGMTRRQAVSAISRRHRLSAKTVYQAIEDAKKSVG